MMDVDSRQYEQVELAAGAKQSQEMALSGDAITAEKRLPQSERSNTAFVINDKDVHNIILSYLLHNCFRETAESFISCAGMNQPADYPMEMDKRKPIFHSAMEGNALKAIELTQELAHDLLEKNEDLHFDLLSLHFVELVCSKKCTEALEFAQTKLTPFGKVQKFVEKLEDFMALLAYEEPEKSPMFHLLSREYRQNVADSLNQAILAYSNLPSYPSLERLIQQTAVVRQCLSQELGKTRACARMLFAGPVPRSRLGAGAWRSPSKVSLDQDGPPPFSLKAFLKS